MVPTDVASEAGDETGTGVERVDVVRSGPTTGPYCGDRGWERVSRVSRGERVRKLGCREEGVLWQGKRSWWVGPQ